MKLTNIHMIIILVCTIIFSAILGPNIEEGMMNTTQKQQKHWKGKHVKNKNECDSINGAKWTGGGKNNLHGCDSSFKCCVPDHSHSGGSNNNNKHPKNNKHKNHPKNNKHNKHKSKQMVFSPDSLSEPINISQFKRNLVKDYNKNPYNTNIDYDSDSDSSGQNTSYSTMNNGYMDTDSDSDDDYGGSNYNKPYPQSRRPGPFDPPMGSSGSTQSQGIPYNQISYGDEDKYILKSEIVPPVCPACPTVTNCPDTKKERPCPPCARCPEPSFECKKVPKYTRTNSMLPVPMLNDFSKF